MNNHKHVISKIYEQVYVIDNVKKLIGFILKQLKQDIVPRCDRALLTPLLCKGNTTRSMSPHQVCHAASVYAVQYHLKEGYTLESAKQLGCMMWNKLNKCNYFVKWVETLQFEDDHDDVSMSLLEKMCRIHHRRCNYSAIQHMVYKTANKLRLYTFWMCYDEAIKNVHKVSQTNINNGLRKWNHDNQCDFFQFKNKKKLKEDVFKFNKKKQ